MTVSLEGMTTTTVASTGPQTQGLEASRNLFEHMLDTAGGMPQGAGPSQLGDGLMARLNDFIDRQRTFADHAALSANPSASGTWSEPGRVPQTQGVERSASTFEPDSAAHSRQHVGDHQVDHIVQSLGRMFDYSIETQMVVRSATQVSGATNTLLKGQ